MQSITFKHLLIVFLLLPALVKSQEIGANYNENIDLIDNDLIERSEVKWVRGFVNIIPFLNIEDGTITGINQQAIDDFDGIDNLKSVSGLSVDGGGTVKIILSLKYNYKVNNVGVPQSAVEANHVIEATSQILNKENIGAEIDILVIGNEPMWETPVEDANQLVWMTEAMIATVYDWQENQSDWNYDVYVGAINRVNELGDKNTILQKILDIAKNNEYVDGLDIHCHIITMAEAANDLNYIRNTQQFAKKIILTEFSLHRLLVSHLHDELGSWGTEQGYDADTKLYEWINGYLLKAANGEQVNRAEFKSYFESQSWYPKNWFKNFYEVFCKKDVHVATYGFVRYVEDPVFQLDSNSPAWILNLIYNEAVLGRDENGAIVTNPLNHEDFADILAGNVPCDNPNAGKITALDDDWISNETSESMRLYPNPAKNQLRIDQLNIKGPYMVEVVNSTGQVVFKNQYNAQQIHIDIHQLSLERGMYLIRIKNQAALYQQKFMVNQ